MFDRPGRSGSGADEPIEVKLRLSAFVRQIDDFWESACPNLDVYSQGDTEDEARAQIRDAIRLHLEDRLKRGEPVYEEVGTTTVRVAV